MNNKLTQIDGTYAKCLLDSKDKIHSLYEDKSVSLMTFKNAVLDIIKPASDTKKKKVFMSTVQRQYNKTELLFVVNNSILYAEGLGVIK